MEPLDHHQPRREVRRMQAHREELVEQITRHIQHDGSVEPLPGLYFNRRSAPTDPSHGVSVPAFCVIAQGSKEVYLGEDCYRYDPGHYLLATVELPIVSQVVEGSYEQPYLSLRLELDAAVVGAAMVEADIPPPRGHTGAKAIVVSPLDAGLLDAAVRLARLAGSPSEARLLRPLVTREIVYRLLMGAQGDRLRHLTVQGGYTDRIARAIAWLRSEYDKPLRIESIARELGMSVSGFHAQFKAVTAMSPLQFQKQVRLQQARRLLLGEDLDAVGAGRRVGYDDASYFSREYRKFFGVPPMRDVQQLRAAASTSADL
jgi:AraC-like DNA-binding protein